MTTEEAKALAVRKAYGEYWEQVKDFVNDNGWVADEYLDNETGCLLDCIDMQALDKIGYNGEPVGYSHYRPRSLSGIEYNNGWIRIEPDGSNLPEQKEWMYQVISKKAGYCLAPFVNGTPVSTPEYWLKHFTHWKPIEKSEPIY